VQLAAVSAVVAATGSSA